MTKRKLYEHKHPFDEHAFEAYLGGTWSTVDVIEIVDGKVVLHFVNGGLLTAKQTTFSNIRIKCRKATLADCMCFLRSGIDICAMSFFQSHRDVDGDTSKPVWNDARICSIQRSSHQTCCRCEFSVKFYEDDSPEGGGRGKLSEEVRVVNIDQISILQKLEKNPCENVQYRWNFSKDCFSIQSSKLVVGKFLSDMTWLLVVSCLRRIKFDLLSFKNKIMYQIIDDSYDTNVSISSGMFHALNFRKEDEVSVPIIMPFSHVNPLAVSDASNIGIIPFYDLLCLRRSQRRNIQLNNDIFARYLLGSTIHSPRVDVPKIKHRELTWVPSRLSKQPIKIETPMLEWRKETQLSPIPSLNSTDPISEEGGMDDLDGFICGNICGSSHIGASRKTVSRIGVGRWNRNGQRKKAPKKSSCNAFFEIEEHKARSNRSPYCSIEYNEMMQKYMDDIGLTAKKEQSVGTKPWKQNRVFMEEDEQKSCPESLEGEEVENIDMLWKEMELAMASTYIFEQIGGEVQDSIKEEHAILPGDLTCKHQYKLNEEVGILCPICGFVRTEIKYVFPDFVKKSHVARKSNLSNDSENMLTEEDKLFHVPVSQKQEQQQKPFLGGKWNAWDLIPELRDKLHPHQIKAFEFMWNNIGGTDGAMCSETATDRGGCVISHSPGSGKTFLVITFLLAYLKLFPGSRPLVLAPKTVLYVWYKEALKWGISIPVYRIHDSKGFRHSKTDDPGSAGGKSQGREVDHILDCLEKIQKWHSHPSILLLGYTSFLSMTRESKFLHRKYLGRVLCESPGILILDEGHNPRSTKSRLRKMLMKVKTDLRILLSGTLFQNNFGEYFNTLCMARPRFMYDILKALGSSRNRSRPNTMTNPPAAEKRARKLFIEKVANPINSDESESRASGLTLLKTLTSAFIHIHDGSGSSSGTLPGLHYYTLLLNPAQAQLPSLNKLQTLVSKHGTNQLELEVLITLCSIHPWLVKTAPCSAKFFLDREMDELAKHRFDHGRGSTKVRFVVNLVHLSIQRGEKVLVFCRNIAPMGLLADILSGVYGWRRGREVLVLQGDMELGERAEVMERFDDIRGAAKVLIVSTSACSEGVSLTAASRVVLLDMEWNPSRRKQAVARAFRPGQERVVYVYQLLMRGTLEEEKHGRTEYKERVSGLIFSRGGGGGGGGDGQGHRQKADGIEDDVLREIVQRDRAKSFHIIMKKGKNTHGV